MKQRRFFVWSLLSFSIIVVYAKSKIMIEIKKHHQY